MGTRYSRMKIFHFPEKLESLTRESPVTKPPLHVRMKPCNYCDHHCTYCAYGDSGLQLGQDMVAKDQIPLEKMHEIMDDLVAMGVKAVTLSGGGEPLRYKHILPLARRLAESPMQFATLTNGGQLSGELAEIFSARGTWVRISVDGWDDASYAAYRGIQEGEFTKLLTNMRAFRALGGPCHLGISLIVDQTNATHVLEFCRLMKDNGADSIKVSPVIMYNEGSKSNRYHDPHYEQVLEQVHQAEDELVDDEFEIFNAFHRLSERFTKDYTWCPYLQILPIIGADLNVYSCQDKAYNLDTGVLGSIKDQSFREFWENGRDQFFRIDPSVHCDHHCVANAKNQLILEYLDADQEHLGFV